MSNQDMLDRAENIEVGLSFSGKMSREQVMVRLLDAQKHVRKFKQQAHNELKPYPHGGEL